MRCLLALLALSCVLASPETPAETSRTTTLNAATSTVEACEPSEVNGFPISPEQIIPFTREWFTPATAEVKQTACDSNGRCVDHYEIVEQVKYIHVFGEDKPATKFYVYGDEGMPGAGPTIKTCVGRQTMVRFANRLPDPTSVHLHGAASLSPFDGWASDREFPGESKDYWYPNRAAKPLWYHDHSEHITSNNANLGLAGQYWVKDCCNPIESQLPTGKYELPMILGDKVFDSAYQVYYDQEGKHDKDMWGDHTLVNGVPFPFLVVEPRKYKFRVLNAAISRAFYLELSNGADLTITTTDGGFLEFPVTVRKLRVGVAERYDVVIDFTGLEGRNIRLMNIPEKDQDGQAMFCYSHYIAEFRVRGPVTTPDQPLPQRLLTHRPMAELGINENAVAQAINEGKVRTFDFGRQGGQWAINGLVWDDVESRIIAEPNLNGFEIWKLQNNHGGWFHPIHIHLVDFFILRREVGIDVPGQNSDGLFPYEANAAKDVFYLGPGDTMYVVARFGAHKGQYMFHCHNLVHEDNDMMLAMDVEGPNREAGIPDSPGTSQDEQPDSRPAVPIDTAPPVTPSYLRRMLEEEDFYGVFFPKEQRNGLRHDCGNMWEVLYTKPCASRCCSCGQRRQDSEVCAIDATDFIETTCENGEQPPFLSGPGEVPANPALARVIGIHLIDTTTSLLHFSDPLPNPFTFRYEQIGTDKIVFCASLNTQLADGAGVSFKITRQIRGTERTIRTFTDRRSPYCVVQDEGVPDDFEDIRYHELDPELASGQYTITAYAEDAGGRRTTPFVQTIRVRG